MPILIFILLHWFLSLFCQTFFLHRYAAHRMFTMSRFWERFFYVMSFLTQGSSYLNPRAYAIMHRMHHAYSDTEDDPHSPHHASLWKMIVNMWITYGDFVRGKIVPDKKFAQNVPEWKAFEKMTDSYLIRILWGVIYSCYYFYFINDLWMLIFLPIHYLMGPIHGGIVNWCGHKYGYRNFENDDKSRNTLVMDFLMMGELYQNNHHKFPNRLNFAFRWFEIDPVYPIIRFLQFVRVIHKPPQTA
ncbi:acyl-CoA desaturase [bacterium]|nr:acyl-CoA desaturase [bacterium]